MADANHRFNELLYRLQDSDALTVRHRQDLLDFLAERRRLQEANARYEAHIAQMDSVFQELTKRNQDLSDTLSIYEDKIRSLETQLNEEQRKVSRYEFDLSRRRKGTDTGEEYGSQGYTTIQQKLFSTLKENENQKKEIIRLKEVEKDFKQAKRALEERDIKIRNLQIQLDDTFLEMNSDKRILDEYKERIETHRDELDALNDAHEANAKTIISELEYFKKRAVDILQDNLQLISQNDDLKDQLQKLEFDSATYMNKQEGLSEAVSQILGLRTIFDS